MTTKKLIKLILAFDLAFLLGYCQVNGCNCLHIYCRNDCQRLRKNCYKIFPGVAPRLDKNGDL